MKKILILAIAVVGTFFSANAQDYGCATDAHLEQLLNNEQARTTYEQQLRSFDVNAANRLGSREAAEYTIPVVVHVLYSTCEGNISMSQIEDGIRVINDDFRRRNTDTNVTRDIFADHAVDSGIEFRLATIDPSGDPTDGVNRIETEQAIDAENNVKSISFWPSNEYLNIWIVESIENFSEAGTVLGYAQFPGSGSWNTYGIVMRNDAFGTIGTSSADGRTLTHEVGHCLNLLHTFQSGCGSDCSFTGDRVCDTPPASNPTFGCSFGTNTCTNDEGTGSPYIDGTPDQIENYMSYNVCQNMFTAGQKNRMAAAFSTYSQLENLVSEENLIATGVYGLVTADFTTSKSIICRAEPVVFSDQSSFAANAESWIFGDYAQPAKSEDAQPEVKFPQEGLHDITYTASEGQSFATISKPVFVVSDEGHYAPYTDDLETANEISNDNWYVLNPDSDEYSWKLTTEASNSGQKSIKLDNYGKCGSTIDELVTRSFDFSPYTSVNIKVAQAYAPGSFGNQNFLRLYASDDCGESWGLVWAQSGTSLQTENTIQDQPYIPSSEDWVERSIDINQSAFLKEGVILKWTFEGLGGNNLYLDDFEIRGEFSGDLLLSSPENGHQGQAKDVLINWKSPGIVDSYEWELDQTAAFDSENLMSETTEFINTNPDNEDTEAFIQDLDLNTTYFWRVRYIQDGVESEWSQTWNFKVDETGLGTQEIAPESTISLFPNPTNGIVTIQSSSQMNVLQFFDYTGRALLIENVNGATQSTIDPQLPSGLYVVRVSLENGETLTKQLVIQ